MGITPFMKGEIMSKITPIIKTTFDIPTKQGKNIYTPIQKLTGKNKMEGTIGKDTITLSTYNRSHTEEMLDVLTNLKAKFKMITQSEK